MATTFKAVNGKPTVAIHKFSSCDGCQLAFLNLGEPLLQLAELVELVHFPEAGPVAEEAQVDIAFVEGSISTQAEYARIRRVRENSRYLITIGACATSGGLQALRNHRDSADWLAGVYARPEYLDSLATATPIAEHVRVDLELWGCPINGQQVIAAVRSLLFGVTPVVNHDALCLDCKRNGNVCVMVTKGEPCMGPVTGTGCGALCPQMGRACYACYGPAENPNTASFSQRLQGLGLMPQQISDRFMFINNNAPGFTQAAKDVVGGGDD